jgi:uncharacterized protein
MINFKNLFKELISQFHSSDLPIVLPRQYTIPDIQREIITIIGPRRSGKTYLLFAKINELKLNGVSSSKLIYINFEDERLLQLDVTELNSILEAQKESEPEIELKDCYFFFDEIQNIDNWEKFIRRMHDSITKNIYLTGSNSKFLTSDIATALRGRSINIEIHNLSFNEFLSFKTIDRKKIIQNKGLFVKYYNEYIQYGGYPSVVLNDNIIEKINLLQSYYNTLIQKDLQERYKIQNLELLKYFCQEIIQNNSYIISLNKLSNLAKTKGYKFEKNYIYSLYDSIQNVYLGKSISKYSDSFRKSQLSVKKFYLLDNGIYNTIRYKASTNNGVLLESLVFQQLNNNKDNEIFFYKDSNDYECDFVVKNAQIMGDVVGLYQVSVNMEDPATLKRELKGLVVAIKYFGLKEGTIIVQEETSRTLIVDGHEIKILNIKDFLLID